MITGMGFIGTKTGGLYRMNGRRTVKKTASGNPITLTDSVENKPLGMTLYGWSKQDGTPSPENPVEIESAGMRWSMGKNLLNADEYYSKFKQSDGTYKGMVGTIHNIQIKATSDMIGKTYTISEEVTVPAEVISCRIECVVNGSSIFSNRVMGGNSGKMIVKFTPTSVDDYFCITYGDCSTCLIMFYNLQLELGSVATSYEPYTGGVPKPYGDKVGIGVYGKNLFDERLLDNKNNYDIQYQSSGYWILAIPVKNGLVTVSVKNTTNWGGYLCVNSTGIVGDVGGVWMAHGSVLHLKRTATLTITHGFVYLLMSKGVDTNKRTLEEVGYIQVEYGTEATSYEPYKQPQSTYIITPNGLPGIPVPSNTAGITYTDANGQAWIADEIDLERGKYVQRIGKVDLENLLWKLIGNCFRSGAISDSKVYKWTSEIANIICSHYICKMTSYNMQYNSDGQDNLIGMYANQIEIKDTRYNKDVDLFKQSLSGVYAYYVLAIPVERDLTSAELAEYTQLYSYKPTTVVENDSDCWMDVTYRGKK